MSIKEERIPPKQVMIMVNNLRDRVADKLESYKDMGYSQERAVKRASRVFSGVRPSYVKRTAGKVFRGSKVSSRSRPGGGQRLKQPEMMEASEKDEVVRGKKIEGDFVKGERKKTKGPGTKIEGGVMVDNKKIGKIRDNESKSEALKRLNVNVSDEAHEAMDLQKTLKEKGAVEAVRERGLPGEEDEDLNEALEVKEEMDKKGAREVAKERDGWREIGDNSLTKESRVEQSEGHGKSGTSNNTGVNKHDENETDFINLTGTVVASRYGKRELVKGAMVRLDVGRESYYAEQKTGKNGTFWIEVPRTDEVETREEGTLIIDKGKSSYNSDNDSDFSYRRKNKNGVNVELSDNTSIELKMTKAKKGVGGSKLEPGNDGNTGGNEPTNDGNTGGNEPGDDEVPEKFQGKWFCVECKSFFDKPKKGGSGSPHLMEGTAAKIGSSIAVLVVSVIVMRLLGFDGIPFAVTLLGVISLIIDSIIPREEPFIVVRPVFRPLGILFIASGLYVLFDGRPIFSMIPLFITAFGLFSLPTRLSVDLDDEVMEDKIEGLMELIRTLYSAGILVLFYLTFRHGFSFSEMPFLTTSFVALLFAYFIVFPDLSKFTEEDSEGKIDSMQETGEAMAKMMENAAGKASGTGTLITILKYLIPFLAGFIPAGLVMGWIEGLFVGVAVLIITKVGKMLFETGNPSIMVSAFFGLTGTALGIWALLGEPFALVIYTGIVSMGLLVAIPIPEARPVMGVMVLPIALMAASAAYPEIMGEAVFGEWWPTVRARAEELQQTMAPAMEGFTQVQDTLGTGWECLGSPMDCYEMWEAEGEVEKEYRALRVGIPEPVGIGRVGDISELGSNEEAFSAHFEVENMLSHANYINPPIIEDVSISAMDAEDVGTDRIFGDGGDVSGPNCGDDDVCEVGDIPPGVMHLYSLTYEGRHFDLDKFEPDPGDYIRYGVTASYSVTTSSILDLEVMNSDRFEDLTTWGELDFYYEPSTYEWGPIEVGISAGRQQPVKGGEDSPIIITLRNNDRGYLTDIKDLTIVSEGDLADFDDCDFKGDFKSRLDDIDSRGLEPSGSEFDSITEQCMVGIEDPEQMSTTFDIRVDLEYEYEVESTGRVEVMYTGED